jgi:Transposase
MSRNKQRRFTNEFKREAVRLTLTSGRGVERVANDLGIAKSTLSRWRSEHESSERLLLWVIESSRPRLRTKSRTDNFGPRHIIRERCNSCGRINRGLSGLASCSPIVTVSKPQGPTQLCARYLLVGPDGREIVF